MRKIDYKNDYVIYKMIPSTTPYNLTSMYETMLRLLVIGFIFMTFDPRSYVTFIITIIIMQKPALRFVLDILWKYLTIIYMNILYPEEVAKLDSPTLSQITFSKTLFNPAITIGDWNNFLAKMTAYAHLLGYIVHNDNDDLVISKRNDKFDIRIIPETENLQTNFGSIPITTGNSIASSITGKSTMSTPISTITENPLERIKHVESQLTRPEFNSDTNANLLARSEFTANPIHTTIPNITGTSIPVSFANDRVPLYKRNRDGLFDEIVDLSQITRDTDIYVKGLDGSYTVTKSDPNKHIHLYAKIGDPPIMVSVPKFIPNIAMYQQLDNGEYISIEKDPTLFSSFING